MKKVFFIGLLCGIYSAATINTAQNQNITIAFAEKESKLYKPAEGPLKLGLYDTRVYDPYIGDIMNTILHHDELKTEFITALQNSCDNPEDSDAIFQSLLCGEFSYQAIINILFEQKSAKAKPILHAIEKALIELYREYAYMYHNKFINTYFITTGIRQPGCIFSDSDALEQIINELEQIAEKAAIHYPAEGYRLKLKVYHYRNWRKHYVKAAAAGAITAMCGLLAYALNTN